MLKPIIYWTLVVLYAGFIFYLSSGPITVNVPGNDKLHHMGEFGIFSFLLYNALRSSLKDERPWRMALLAIILALLYGISDEFHQSFVPTRTADPYDVAADVAGAIVMQCLISFKERFFV